MKLENNTCILQHDVPIAKELKILLISAMFSM